MVRLHGRWCGPNWTNNQVKPAKDATSADRRGNCTDSLDCACKRHDLDIADDGPSYESDTRLMRKALAIMNNPLYAVTNPRMYAAAFVVHDAMAVVRWTRSN